MGSMIANIGKGWKGIGGGGKNEKLAGRAKERLTAVCEVVEEEGGKIKEWVEEDEMGQMEDTSNEL